MSIINSHPLFLSSSAADMALEIWASLRFFFAFLRGDPNARGNSKMKAADTRGKDFGEAFGVAPPSVSPFGVIQAGSRESAVSGTEVHASAGGRRRATHCREIEHEYRKR